MVILSLMVERWSNMEKERKLWMMGQRTPEIGLMECNMGTEKRRIRSKAILILVHGSTG